MSGDPDELLLTDEMEAEFRVPESTWRSWRSLDRGPRSFKLGRRIVFRRGDVQQWIEEQREATGRGGN